MRKHFFLIDDDEDELFIFSTALKKINIPSKCTYANNGQHAIEMLKYLRPDYIFIDVNMPGHNGMEILSQIKRLCDCEESNLIMYSNGIDESLVRLASQQGACACIKKTANIESLVEGIELLLLKTDQSMVINPESS